MEKEKTIEKAEVAEEAEGKKVPETLPAAAATDTSKPPVEPDDNEALVPDLTAAENPAADWRNMRRIIAEDPEWTLAIVPDLTELCLKHIVQNFANNSPILNELLPKHQANVLGRISTSLPLQITAMLVDDEGYWERCCKTRWEVCDVAAHGGVWKRLFFERHVQNIIELFVPDTTDPTELLEMLKLSADVIRKLDIGQLLPPVKEDSKHLDLPDSDAESDSEEEKESEHFSFEPVLKTLHKLEELHITYGVRDCGMNFEWPSFLFKSIDCLKLAHCLSACHTLRLFHLHRSKVDDEKTRVLTHHLLDHPTLEELDLSFNIISDKGARALGKLLNNHSRLVRLNLMDNNIRGSGAMALAHALLKNTTLKFLNLKHNHLGDEGGQAVCRAMVKNITLVEVNLSSNELGEPTASMLSQALTANSTLKSLDLSCNRLGPDGGKHVKEGLDQNYSITAMDLRLTDVGQEADYTINLMLHRNLEAARDVALKAREASAGPQRKEADPQAAHRFQLEPDMVF